MIRPLLCAFAAIVCGIDAVYRHDYPCLFLSIVNSFFCGFMLADKEAPHD